MLSLGQMNITAGISRTRSSKVIADVRQQQQTEICMSLNKPQILLPGILSECHLRQQAALLSSFVANRPQGSRQTATLTPDKLERKRTHDRIAQRAARQRTKQYIAQLEFAVRELELQTASDPVVQELTSQNQALTAEIVYLRTCLTFKNAVMSWTPFHELYHVERHPQFLGPAVSALPGPWTYQQVSGPSNASAFNTLSSSDEISGTTMFTDKQRQHGNADQRTPLEHSLVW
ncbi:hypothetical protein VFPPC_18564 [Pochonia chlamydosporia 170]|uniref:BZIP domain-containing protein n=1 Tax=Pochonia chlamydosporia 170 TaxID=1380566 RepID=A0A219ANA6_METCM|nr:hypothetical protein VFPPC_18564 [Pochonia chlamydosporia 170]OWT42330.1 hypothetical protein VFPPC_18564 [Pochonia chlamydosporia 170]